MNGRGHSGVFLINNLAFVGGVNLPMISIHVDLHAIDRTPKTLSERDLPMQYDH